MAFAIAAVAFGSPAEAGLVERFAAERFAVERIAIDRLRLEVVASGEASRGPFRASRLIVPLARLVDAEVTPELALGDVTIRRVGDSAGWDGEATFDAVRITDGPAFGERSITMNGALNAAPLELTATFAAAAPAADGRLQRPFSLSASLRGVDETIDGVLDADGQNLEARIRFEVAALGDLLELFGLRRQLEGRGRLQLDVAGPVDALAADALGLEVQLVTGEQLRADGRIADLASLAGIDIGFTANLTATAEAGTRSSGLELEALRGRVQGSAAAVTVEDLVLSTNLTSTEIREIGPIRIERLGRDAHGRLALAGVRILAGDPAAPSLDLAGRIDDLLGRSGIAFEGRFDLDLIDLATGLPAPPELGRLVGTLALSDAAGQLQLQRLDARQSGRGPLELRLSKAAVGRGRAPSPVTLELTIPDLDALAAARGMGPIGGGSAALAGTIDLGRPLRVTGSGHVGGSPVWLDLTTEVVDDALQLRGGIDSPGLQLGDLPRMVDLVRLWPRPEVEREDGTAEQLRRRLDAELDLDASIIDAGGGAEGTFTGRLTLRDETLRLRPLRLDYLGGRAAAEFSLAMGTEPPPMRLEARIDALDTARLLTELGIRPLLVADLDGILDLAATGPDRAALLRSLDGEIEFLLGPGRIGSRLIELAAQDVVSWLFSAGTATRLVCAAGRLRFTAGRGEVEGLLLKTENIQLVGAGDIDLGQERIDLTFAPRPMRGRLLPAVTSFRIRGPLDRPAVTVSAAGGVAGRAVVETLTLPFNVLGALLGTITGNGSQEACTLEP